MALTAIVDHNGTALAVGDTVKLLGTITALNTADTHYKEVTIQISYPVSGVPNAEVAGFAPTIHGPALHVPGSDQIIGCSGTMLVKV